jgi:hypothetical protein
MTVKRRLVGWALAVGLCLGATSAAAAWADAAQQVPPDQAGAALAASLQAAGTVYAGDCATTQSPRDVGAVCSRFVAVQSGLYAFETGGTFSEFDQWVFVTQNGPTWQVVATVPLDNAMTSIPWPVASPQPASAG